MQSPAAARPKAPYGLSFHISELVFVRDWAARQSALLSVRLDQVLDGAEFEELLQLCWPGRGRPPLTIWRTDRSVIAQEQGGAPKAFAGVQMALAHFAEGAPLASPRKRVTPRWRKLLARF